MIRFHQRQRSRQRVERALPGTVHEIVTRTGLGRTTVRNYLRELREERVIYVSKWLRSNGRGGFQPYFRLGKRKDATCKLVPYTIAERSERFKSRHVEDGTWEDKRCRINSRNAIKRTIEKGDPLVSAFFGR